MGRIGMRNKYVRLELKRRRRNPEEMKRGIKIIALFCIGIFIIRNSSHIGIMEGFYEENVVVLEELRDSLEGMTASFVEELIPMKSVLDGKSTSYKESVVAWILKEFLPATHFQSGYEAKETLVVDNQDYLYLMEENEEEHQDQMQETELKIESDTKKEEETTETVASAKENKTTGKQYTKAQLYSTKFLVENFYLVESTARLLPSEINGKTLLNKDLTIDTKGSEPKILIYHTHASETFQDSRAGKEEDSVVGVGSYLTKQLEEKYNISVYHDKTVYDIIDGKLDRSRAYNMALIGIEKILKENPSIEVVIDLHRDGVAEGTKLVTTVNGKKMAKIMFMNGISRSSKNGDISYLYNPNKEGNLAFTLQMQLDAESKFPTLMRKIYIKTYRYNLHVKPRSVLVEVGANTNTVQEVKNSMVPLAEMLSDVLQEKR